MPEAIARVTSLLAQQWQGLPLVDCLPLIPAGTGQRQLRQRVALASTLVVSLKLARDATLDMDQEVAFGTITLRPKLGRGIDQRRIA